MSISFPTSLDTLTNPAGSDSLTGHALQHANVNDAIEALEAKVGINSSADTNSLDYKVANAIPSSEKGAVSGVAPLGADSKVPSAYLPSYVDDVVEVANYAALPGTGESGKIYITVDNNKQFRWTGTVYVELTASPGTTDAVPEGTTNLYFTAQRVRDAVLTGLSLASSAVISATDSVLSAIGKLQAQITGKQDELVSGTNIKTINGSSVLGSGNLTVSGGDAFNKNKLINGEVTRINQRAFNGTWSGKSVWETQPATIAGKEAAYGYDMWFRSNAARSDSTGASENMAQWIEAGNFRPSTVHTLSGTGVTTTQITSPASGDWKIVVAQGATNVQVEEGTVDTPFELRSIRYELAECQRYYVSIATYTMTSARGGYWPVPMRTTPSASATVGAFYVESSMSWSFSAGSYLASTVTASAVI